jgi:hypothetical protein
MNITTSAGALVFAAWMLTGGAPVRPNNPSATPAKAVVVAADAGKSNAEASIGVADPCCNKCQRGLLAIFQRQRCKCDSCTQKVCHDHCKTVRCCEYRRKLSFLRLIRRILGIRDRCCVPCNPCESVKLTAVEPTKPALKPVLPPEQPKPDYARDYSWIQGELRYVHVNGGAWVVRYAPLDKNDKYGGSVVLSRDSRMQRYRDGDFVRIEGEILSDTSTVFLGGPLYRIQDVVLVQNGSDVFMR